MNFRLVKWLTIGNISTFKHICCEITLGCTKCVILSIYRPGSSPPQAKFFSEFESLLERLSTINPMVVINGDINIRLDLATDPHMIKFTALLSSKEVDV